MSFYKEVPGRQTTLESTLKFDTAPTAGSTNPVTSDGVNTAITDAVGDASEALQEQIDDIAEKAGSGYTSKGPASAATLNGLTGQENGWLYTMTDAGTLTDGSLAVVAGDTVAWDATNSVWYKAMDYAPAQYGTNEVHNLATTITAFRTGDVIPVDGPDGAAKMSKNSLLKEAVAEASKELFIDGENFDFAISDDVQNVLLELLQGHIKTKNFDSRQNAYYQKDGVYDFAVVDDNDNVLAEFDGGHIKTKNFDSRNVTLDLTGKKISILGDSISTYTGYVPTGHAAEYSGSNHGVTSVNQTWWKRLLDKTGAVLGVNESWAGSGVSGTDDGVKAISTARLNNIGANGTPDIIIIQVGTNDVNKDFGDFEFWKLAKGETYTTTKFFPAYSYIVEKLLTLYSSRIICMSPIYRNPAGWNNLNANNPYGNTMTQMVEGIKKIAETYHVDFIPLDACGINVNNYTTYLSDNRPAEPAYQVHPNPAGFELMFKKIYNEMKTMSFT